MENVEKTETDIGKLGEKKIITQKTRLVIKSIRSIPNTHFWMNVTITKINLKFLFLNVIITVLVRLSRHFIFF